MTPSKKDFKKWRNPKFGNANPQDMTNPFWVWAVMNPQSGYLANETFNGKCSIKKGPCWSFERFGRTKTKLADGSTVFIAGEHEDSYAPDFFIYNDVTVVTPDGEVTIYGYPQSEFPSTDFHSASLVGEQIIIIGSLGYPDQRNASKTQVYILNTQDWSISPQETTNSPGWISRHKAELLEQEQKIRVSGMQRWTEDIDLIKDYSVWELDLSTWAWACVQKSNWTQYRIERVDGETNNLWSIRSSLEKDEIGIDMSNTYEQFSFEHDDETKAILKDMQKEQDDLLSNTDTSLLASLYHPSVDFTEIPIPEIDWSEEEDEDDEDEDYTYNQHRIMVDGVEICFSEEPYDINVCVEGELPQQTLNTILNDVAKNLSQLEQTDYKWSKLS